MRQSQHLRDIAVELRDNGKKVQLIYAFNGSGKTRLSREFKNLVAAERADEGCGGDSSRSKILYYNAFTEDLFYWDNDLENDSAPKLLIQPNTFTQWALKDQGLDQRVIEIFQQYTDDKLTPEFNTDFSEVTFSFQRGDDALDRDIKISKGEESNLIWSLFQALLDQVIQTLNINEEAERDTDQFNDLQYIFIDDPVSSLDENHLIKLAVDLATLIKGNSSGLRFIISTHNPLFFNVLSNELHSKGRDNSNWRPGDHAKWLLEKTELGGFELREQHSDSPFSYHLFLISEVRQAIESGEVRKYHFGLMRNILEKTATFLGLKRWEELLPVTTEGETDPYAKRLANYGSHSRHGGEEVEPIPPEIRNMLKIIFEHLVSSGLKFDQVEVAPITKVEEAS